jgi:hypothetical protein
MTLKGLGVVEFEEEKTGQEDIYPENTAKSLNQENIDSTNENFENYTDNRRKEKGGSFTVFMLL